MTTTQRSAHPTVGFVGLGDQGAPIAAAIADAGYPLQVWARRPASLKALTGVPFTAHATVAALAAASDIVALCLPEDSDNLEVATTGGLLAHMRRGSVLVNHGTGTPRAMQQLAELAAPYGIEVVDAPVSGGRAVALARQLTTIVGGQEAVVDRLRPVFNTFSKRVIHVGAIGSGQSGKLFNNTLMMMNHQNLIEILALAEELGLPLTPLLEVFRSGSATSFALEAFGPAITVENSAHLTGLELIDMDLFSTATEALGNARANVVRRAVAGANGLSGLAALIEDKR
jgi:3-hydroxyisobutyrate dehydrogenase-like beta-hydroxyacid dehydrogenase